MNRAALVLVLLPLTACLPEPLTQIPDPDPLDDREVVPGDDDDAIFPDDPNDPGDDTTPPDDDTTPPDDDTTPPDEPIDDTPVGPPDFGGPSPVFCADGSQGASWHDTLPALPEPLLPNNQLASGSGVAAATCNGDPVQSTQPDTWDSIQTEQRHGSGQWYFEVTSQSADPGWSSAGIFAPPASSFDMLYGGVFTDDGVSAAGSYLPTTGGVLSIAADLDAGVVFFYEDGNFAGSQSLLVVPGVGAYHAAVDMMFGEIASANFGSEPFAFEVPDGYQAWSSGEASPAGNCLSDGDVPAPAAPITVLCDGSNACLAPTFDSGIESDVQLVVLGVYDSGSEANWQWNVDEDGNAFEEPTGPGQNGSVLVRVSRPGRIALVLSAYEPTEWTVIVENAETTLESVSIYGMHMQFADVPDGVPFDIHTICGDTNGGGNCDVAGNDNFPVAPFQWPFDTGGGDTQGFVTEIESRLCLPLRLFGGQYEARGFNVQ